MPEEIPKGWKTKKLSDLLTDEQIEEVRRILEEPNLDDFERSNKLKRYFESFRHELATRGADAGFLAYAIVFRQWTGGTNGKH